MLRSLNIENFAIIDHVTLDLEMGMTVLARETGAGKSIIIDALSLLMGSRGTNDLIRQGADKLVVEGLFSMSPAPAPLLAQLADFGLELEDQEDLIIRRELNRQGKNTVRVNGQLANVSLLKQIGYYLVDIHGQNEHQALLNKQFHLSQLDQFAGDRLNQLKQTYQIAFERYDQLRKDWLASQQEGTDKRQRLSFLEFQLQELEAANLVAGEMAQLEQESRRLQNSQKIGQALATVNYLLSEADTSALTQLSQAQAALEEVASYDSSYPALAAQLQDLYYQLEEVAHQLAVSNQVVDNDQAIDELEARLSQLGQLTRKYGMDEAQLLAYYDAISEEIYQLTHQEQYTERLVKDLTVAYHDCLAAGQALDQGRRREAQDLVVAIEAELADLYMANARFQVDFTSLGSDASLASLLPDAQRLSAEGLSQVEFYATTNLGEAMKPLVKIASGGELSRFMLALKRVFSQGMTDMTLVFDEIDTGVSGRVAQAIAEKKQGIAQHHQLLCITHLAQVAASADQHLYIEKVVENERTRTRVQALNEEGRIEAIASMMSGKVLTPASLQMAQDLRRQLQAHRAKLGEED